MDISDFFGIYPDDRSPTFNGELSRKKEFLELETEAKSEKVPPRGTGFKSQIFVSRFMSVYDKLFMIHEPGTGKTCAMVYAAEALKHKYRANPHDPSTIRKVYILVKGNNLQVNFEDQIINVCTDEKEYAIDEKDLRQMTMNKQKRSKLKEWYDIMTYVQFGNHVNSFADDEGLEKEMSGVAIFIDEAHNLYNIREDKQMETVYKAILKAIRIGKRNKVILATATPMINSADDIRFLLDLLNPYDMPVKSGISKMKFEEFEPHVRGMISYVREADNGIVKDTVGDTLIDDSHIKLYDLEMIENQREAYKKIIKSKKTQSFESHSRQCTLMIYPDGSYGIDGYTKYMIRDTFDIKREYQQEFYEAMSPQNIDKYSAKYAATIDLIQESEYTESMKEVSDDVGIVFVYFSDFVHGSGLYPFAAIMKSRGYEYYDGSAPMIMYNGTINPSFRKKKRFTVIQGSMTRNNIHNILEAINSDQNTYGEYISVVIGSLASGEGININNAVKMIKISPHWNKARDKQADYRILRATSHVNRLKNRKSKEPFKVKFYNLVTFYREGDEEMFGIDVSMYNNMEEKDKEIARVMRYLKMSAVDCYIHRKRNQRDTDTDYSPECDYDVCKYTCNGVTDTIDVDYSTKRLNYSERDIDDAMRKISQYLKDRVSFSSDDIIHSFPDIDPYVIYESLNRMVKSHKHVIDKFGRMMYVKLSPGGTFYLSPSMFSLGESEQEAVYNSMMIKSRDTRKNIIEEYVNQKEVEYHGVLDKKSILRMPKLKRVQILEDSILKGDTTIQDIYRSRIYEIPRPEIFIATVESLIRVNKGTKNMVKTILNKLTQSHTEELMSEIRRGMSRKIVFHTAMTEYDTSKFNITNRYQIGIRNIRILDGKKWRDATESESIVYNHYIRTIIAQDSDDFIQRIHDPDYPTYYGTRLIRRDEVLIFIRDTSQNNPGRQLKTIQDVDTLEAIMYNLGITENTYSLTTSEKQELIKTTLEAKNLVYEIDDSI